MNIFERMNSKISILQIFEEWFARLFSCMMAIKTKNSVGLKDFTKQNYRKKDAEMSNKF